MVFFSSERPFSLPWNLRHGRPGQTLPVRPFRSGCSFTILMPILAVPSHLTTARITSPQFQRRTSSSAAAPTGNGTRIPITGESQAMDSRPLKRELSFRSRFLCHCISSDGPGRTTGFRSPASLSVKQLFSASAFQRRTKSSPEGVPPNDVDVPRGNSDCSGDFHFGLLRRGAYEGWPSSHIMDAFAMATTLVELYPANTTILVVSSLYASAIGVGESTNIHWLSDAVAGAFIGYAIGKTVRDDFKKLLAGREQDSPINFCASPEEIRITYRF